MNEILLNRHGIETMIIGGKLWAIDAYTQYGLFFEEWKNLSDYDRQEIYNWLGC